jgi:hypothetical protein
MADTFCTIRAVQEGLGIEYLNSPFGPIALITSVKPGKDGYEGLFVRDICAVALRPEMHVPIASASFAGREPAWAGADLHS